MKLIRLWLLALLTVSGAARAELEITVTGGTEGALPIAIVPFSQGTDVTLDVAQVIDNDLARSGRFRTLARNDMLQKPTTPQQVDVQAWRTQGIDNVVIGQIARADSGYMARFFLIDVVSGQQILGFDIPVKGLDQMRYAAHQIADLIYEKLLGIPGYFNTKIAYVSASGLGYKRTFQLVVADADGWNPRVVATSREPLMSPTWSPDRLKLAYVGYERGRSAIYLHDLATGKVRSLIAERGINGSPAFSPDGRSLALTLSFESNPDIYVMDIASGKRRRLTDHYGIDTEPSWSPDGTKLVFTSDRGGQPQIYEISAQGGDPRRVTFEGRQNLRASYAPDGRSLVMVNLEGGAYRIATLDLATGDMRILSPGRLDESPSFAPGGAVVIYATQGSRGSELATVSIDGRVRQSLRQASGDIREPAWSPLVR
ncbi:Tol-Pal system beta propeller repeat protein TolB [Sinimarinibacterium sp. CAU 1509]|uniref:Tol-Pal system beta propeller repeat protein TolB n=1 Tax=Sinimarinibacterium sp. CAU 1509 TaxID=2562283 RepID=UPI0010ACF0A2|nr:Tol-Pal system beta propeller repeat protein TolB [Sinimarinibacterium sp. CAU 1509]TJY60831.1 Tol-Pal system beta propeller repeat protein TolB [Sinimarinibacterium sp. CAU 1509]